MIEPFVDTLRFTLPSIVGSIVALAARCPDCAPSLHCPAPGAVHCSEVHCHCEGNSTAWRSSPGLGSQTLPLGVSWTVLLLTVVAALTVGFSIGCCVGASLSRRRSVAPRREEPVKGLPPVEQRLTPSRSSSSRPPSAGSDRSVRAEFVEKKLPILDESSEVGDVVWRPRRR